MKKKKIKNLVLLLALTQIISTSTAKANDNEHILFVLDENKKLKVVDDKYMLIYNEKTFVDNMDSLSVFNKTNTISRQFGGNQGAFKTDFNNLINNPYIWEEMQYCYPISLFPSENYAMKFYELYFDLISRRGCGYVSMANRVFQEFEGKENEFEEVFGYPMYIINKDGSIDYNYEIFTLKQYNYATLYPNYNVDKINTIIHMFDKSIAKMFLDEFLKSDEYNIENKKWYELEGEEQLEYIYKYQNRDYKYDELLNNYNNAHDIDIFLGMSRDNYLGYIRDFLENYGLKINLTISDMLFTKDKEYHPGDIIVFNKCYLYKVDEFGKRYSEKEVIYPHSVSVVSVNKGKVIISTWGERYYLDQSKSVPSDRIVLNINVNDKIITR